MNPILHDTLPLPFPADPSTIIWGVYGLVLAVFLLITLVLLYHWIRYAEKRSVFMVCLTVYTAGSSFLIALFTISAFMLTAAV